MDISEDQIAELKELCPEVSRAEEGGFTYFLLPKLQLPEGCEPAVCDALLCPSMRDNYPSRLYFRQVVKSKQALNWHMQNIVILGVPWSVYSWKTMPRERRLIQMVAEHLRALR